MPPETVGKLRAYWLIGATLLSLISYHLLVYQTPRHDFSSILFYFIALTMVYLLVMRTVNHQLLYWALGAALLIRLSLVLAIPELSDDFYRFIWDGRLLAQGTSPFAALPSQLMKEPGINQVLINQQLYQGMNSPDYFTVYPPLAQWVFYLAAVISPDNILVNLVVMRLVVILFEIGSLFLFIKILDGYGLPAQKVLIYAWNPLVIVELTGNLHFEAIMIFFVLLAVYWFQHKHWKLSAVALASGVASKLIPLIFLPLLMFRMEWKKVIGYWILCGLVVVGWFFTVWNPEMMSGMNSSLSLYFQKFEFNASFYYLVREVGYAIKGYNIIQDVGKYLALLTFLLILILSRYTFKSTSWPKAMIWALTIYLLMSTTVHPWYVTPLVALAVFTNYWFPIAWSVLILASYAGYSETGYSENMVLLGVEYLMLGLVIIWDIKAELNAAKD